MAQIDSPLLRRIMNDAVVAVNSLVVFLDTEYQGSLPPEINQAITLADMHIHDAQAMLDEPEGAV